MPLSDEQIQSFIEAWRVDFGEVLTPDVARSEANRLLDFFAAMAQILRHPPNGESGKERSGGHGDLGGIHRVWRKTMRRGHSSHPEQGSA
jgi:hypothetical protein